MSLPRPDAAMAGSDWLVLNTSSLTVSCSDTFCCIKMNGTNHDPAYEDLGHNVTELPSGIANIPGSP